MPDEVTIYTLDDVSPSARNKPVDQIGVHDLKDYQAALEAHRIELHVGGKVYVLKDRFGQSRS
jgi:hypothetical protein